MSMEGKSHQKQIGYNAGSNLLWVRVVRGFLRMLDDSRLEKRETELDLFRRAKTGDFTAFQEIVEQ